MTEKRRDPNFSDAARGFLSFAEEAGQLMAQAGVMEVLELGCDIETLTGATLATAREATRLLIHDAGLTEDEAKAVMIKTLDAAEKEIARMIGGFHESISTPQ